MAKKRIEDSRQKLAETAREQGTLLCRSKDFWKIVTPAASDIGGRATVFSASEKNPVTKRASGLFGGTSLVQHQRSTSYEGVCV